MTKRIQSLDDRTELRHRMLADAERYVWQPGHTVATPSRYALRTPGTETPTGTESRTLKAFLGSGLIEHVLTGTSTYDHKIVKRTEEGNRVLKLWTNRYGSPVEPLLTTEALRYAAEYVTFLEWHAARHKGPFGSGITGAATIISKAAGNDPWADDTDQES